MQAFHDQNVRPFNGPMQAPKGAAAKNNIESVKNDPCPPKALATLAEIIAARLNACIAKDAELKNAKDKVRAIVARTGVGRGSLQRALKGTSAVQTDTLAKLAWAFNVPVWELMHPLEDESRLFEVKKKTSPEVAADSGRESKSRGSRAP